MKRTVRKKKWLLRLGSAVLALVLFGANVFAEETFIATLTEDDATVERVELRGEVDNSQLPVIVVKKTGDEQSVIYVGPLGEYDNGAWANMNFDDMDVLAIFQKNEPSDETVYIIPQREVYIENTNKDATTSEINDIDVGNNTQQNISEAPSVSCDITYTISDESMNITYSAENGENKEQTVTVIAALYKNGILQRVLNSSVALSPGGTGSDSIVMILPEDEVEQCSVRMMVWESLGTLRVIGNSKFVRDLEPYLREKTIVVNAEMSKELKIYMNAENAIGKNGDTEHIIKYNPHKCAPVDLCGLTSERELSEGHIDNTYITVKSVDLTNGEIVFVFDLPDGRNTGINNFIKFKALSDLSGEEITYKIQ